MTCYPDTSFLCALYREQDNSKTADAHRKAMTEILPVTSLVLFEFRQSVRFQTWLHQKDAGKGYGEREGAKMLAHLQSDIDAGLVEIIPVDWAKVHSRAEQLSAQHSTPARPGIAPSIFSTSQPHSNWKQSSSLPSMADKARWRRPWA